MAASSFYEQVYAVVRRIPPGTVTSYGRIAQMLGRPRAARAVGYALSALRDQKSGKYDDVPWQRVVNHRGRISIQNRDKSAARQAELLRAEGVFVDAKLQIDLERYLWTGLHWLELDDILNRG